VLQVRLKKDRRRRAECFEIAGVASAQSVSVSPRDLSLKLNTLNSVGIGETSYWLDTGSVIR
jgi:hypothetical protein